MSLFGFLVLFTINKMIKEFQQVTYDLIDFKVNQDQVKDLVQLMPRVFETIIEFGDAQFAVEIIDITLELLKNLPVEQCADILFMEEILKLLTELELFNTGLTYSELTLTLCERYQQPVVENKQYLRMKNRFLLFKYQCSLQISSNYSRQELRQIEEDINSIEEIIGQPGDVQIRLDTIKQILKPLIEKSDKVMLLKALGLGVLASGLVIAAVVFLIKKRN
ncbi:UNKNOWN [Stylonychia lemnae]|uniref:Uncharacterized protein n=1 Tax=Stylonychia lemnae TaxID=5949 RepID=A0A078AV43_STYLE|nr:UNKNOWN [Stylonychia lemnae]|eukprot:CDW85122.1 UNKNOWN [Stylonychia lemnae]